MKTEEFCLIYASLISQKTRQALETGSTPDAEPNNKG
jgi:hypothetical protein